MKPIRSTVIAILGVLMATGTGCAIEPGATGTGDSAEPVGKSEAALTDTQRICMDECMAGAAASCPDIFVDIAAFYACIAEREKACFVNCTHTGGGPGKRPRIWTKM